VPRSLGASLSRCLTYYVKCNCPSCPEGR
jgi:hypothetical protein